MVLIKNSSGDFTFYYVKNIAWYCHRPPAGLLFFDKQKPALFVPFCMRGSAKGGLRIAFLGMEFL